MPSDNAEKHFLVLGRSALAINLESEKSQVEKKCFVFLGSLFLVGGIDR